MGQLGDTLHARRVDLGITLEQAEERTKIRGKLLQALENGEYDRLPNPGYVRGYITSYARFLELDTVSLLAMYRAETGTGRYHEVAPPPTARVAPRDQQHEVPWRVGLIVFVIIALLSLGVWAFVRLRRGPEKPPPIPTVPTQEVTTTAPAGEESATDSPAVNPADKPPASYTPFTLKVTVAANGASWLQVRVDGKSAYTGSLTGGRSKSFEVTEQASVRIGKPSVVSVYRDGKKVKVPDNGGTPAIVLKADPAP